MSRSLVQDVFLAESVFTRSQRKNVLDYLVGGPRSISDLGYQICLRWGRKRRRIGSRLPIRNGCSGNLFEEELLLLRQFRADKHLRERLRIWFLNIQT